MNTSPTFQRTAFTWLAYAMLGFFAYGQNIFPPAMPFLRDELNINYTLGGMHASLFAVGMLFAGAVTDALTKRVGSRAVLWMGGTGMAGGLLLLIAAPAVQVTLTAALVMGALGTMLLNVINGSLAETHGDLRGVALMEANIAAYIVTAAVPLFVGGFESVGVGWRAAALVGVAAWAGMAALFWRVRLPTSAEQNAQQQAVNRAPLPFAFWVLWVAIVFSVGIEWSLYLWSPDFINTALGLQKELASSLLALFIGAGVLGRIVGSRLARRYAPSSLLLAALGLVFLGFLLFWRGGLLPLNLTGLFVCGFGVAMLFPLGLAAATNAAPHAPNRASARVAVAIGLAILAAPQFLGYLADQFGIAGAFGVVPVLVLLAAGAVWTSRRSSLA